MCYARHPLPNGGSTQPETSHDHGFTVKNFTFLGYVSHAWLLLVGGYITAILWLAQDSERPIPPAAATPATPPVQTYNWTPVG